MNDHLTFLRDLKSVAIATIDNDRPAVRIADLMLVEDEKLYFLVPRGFKITDACIECGICKTACPEKCINASSPYVIGKNCIECGRCFEKCPVNAIIRPQLFRYDEIKG